MRKLMETVETLFEDESVGFKNITVGFDADDVTINGEPTHAATIWIYDNSGMDSLLQKGFGRQDSISDEEYRTILDSVVPQVEQYVKQAHNDRDFDGEGYRFDLIALGSDIGGGLDQKLQGDVIKWTSLDDLYGGTKSDNGYYNVFEINRPKKKRWWSR